MAWLMIFSEHKNLTGLRALVAGFTVMTLGLTGCSISEADMTRRDEAQLRKMFKIPATAQQLQLDSQPKTGGWPREGLRINAIFQFSDDDWPRYQSNNNLNWKMLPIPDDLILKIGNHLPKDSLDESSPSSGQVAEQQQKRFVTKLLETLPKAKSGQFVCLTAGNDLLHEPTVSCQKYSQRFSDFAIGVLDVETQQLKIRVRTYY